MTDLSFPKHLKEHGVGLIPVNSPLCTPEFERKLVRSTKKHISPSATQKDTLENLLESSTIKSLYDSATLPFGKKRRITEATRKKFVNFENVVDATKSSGQGKDKALLEDAFRVKKAVRHAINTKRIVVIKKKRKKKRNNNVVQISSGGLSGLGKKN